MVKFIFFGALFLGIVVLLLAIIRQSSKKYIKNSIENNEFEIGNKDKSSGYFANIEKKGSGILSKKWTQS
ncbi:MAG: hypothetical protein JSU83_10935 [Deltaproteobacteria bacterium]|nr:MAG: hypothetical protein JSU83_10935 [Deltaproteobacteria bacterium]